MILSISLLVFALYLLPYCALRYTLLRLSQSSKDGSEYIDLAHKSLFWGCFGALLLVLPQRYWIHLQDVLSTALFARAWQTLAELWQIYLGSALLEELAKWFMLKMLLRTCFHFQQNGSARHYVLLLGLALGLGFAATENLLYILHFGFSSIYLRLGTAVLVHLGLSIFTAARLYGHRPALVYAVFWHGTYNAALTFGHPILLLGSVFIIVCLAFLGQKNIQ